MSRTFSIVVPVYRNEANLPRTLPRLLALGERLPGYRLELVLVDDGSDDGSGALLSAWARSHPETTTLVRLARNFGQTPAIQAGFRYAAGDCVGVISADLQEPCEALIDMVREWERGAKFVIGERRSREEGAGHRFLSGVYWRLVRRWAFSDFPKLGYDFCLLDRQIVAEVNRMNEKNTSIFPLIYWLGFKPVRLQVDRRLRAEGRSQWTLLKKIAMTMDTLIGFTYLPARVITFLGLTASALCVVYLGGMFGVWAFARSAPPGWMTVFGLLSLIGALVLFSLGIISEYLLRILDEARRRPAFVVDRVERGSIRPLGKIFSGDRTIN